MCQHTQRWALQKGVGVSKQLGWGSPGSVLCGRHPHQPLFPVCAHVHTHTHTHTRFRSMQLPSPATLVSSVCTHARIHTHTHTHTHDSGLCGCHPHQPLFPVCAHARTHTHTHTHTWFRSMRSPSPLTLVSSVCTHTCTHKHTHATFQVSVPIVLGWEERACPGPWLWPDLLGRGWLALVQGLPQRLDEHQSKAVGYQPWTEALHIPLVSLVLTAQLIKLAVAESRHCSLLIS